MARTTLTAIVNRAAQLFNEHGYHQTTMEDIARAAGIEKGSLYHYFNKKEDVLYLVAREPLQMLVEQARQIATGAEPADVKLHKAIRNHIFMFTTKHYPSLFVIAQERTTELPATFRDEILEMERNYQRLWEEMILQGIREGTLEANLNPRLTGFAIVGLCNCMYKWHRPGGPLSPEAIADLFSAIILNGVRRR